MAYYTGTAASVTALRSELINALQAEGWTWNSGQEVIYKGACFMKLALALSWNLGPALLAYPRTALSGGSMPSGADDYGCIGTNVAQVATNYPLFFHIFIFENEVYLVINYSFEYWQFLTFGVSQTPGLLGTGVFVSSTYRARSSSSYTNVILPTNTRNLSFLQSVAVPFYNPPVGNAGSRNTYIDHGLSPASWDVGGASNAQHAVPGFRCTPNGFNGETVFFPIRAYAQVGDNAAVVAELENARYCRVDNYAPGEVVTLGEERWMIIPGFKKNLDDPAPTSPSNHSGGIGWAVRYEGP